MGADVIEAPPKPPAKLISLEIARFIAAFCVGTDHVVSFTASLRPTPVLGGFDLRPSPRSSSSSCLAVCHLYRPSRGFGRLNRLPRFLWRRFWRIYPVYWLSLAVPLYILWPTINPAYLVKIVTLTPFIKDSSFIEIIPPAWSLRFELAFYLLFALSLLPRIGKYILAAWIFFVVWHLYPALLPMKYMHIHLRLPRPVSWHFFGTHEVMFFAGLGAGLAFARLRWQPRALWALLAAAGVALILLARLDSWGFAYPPASRAPMVAYSFAAIIFALAALERGGHLRLSPRLARLGAMSYPFYIFHPTVLFFGGVLIYYHPADKLLFSPLTVFTFFMAASLGISALVTFWYDRPLQRFSRRIL